MKKLVNPVLTYPFCDTDAPAYPCKCGTLMRHLNLHNRNYKVSVDDQNFIISTKPHICVKSNAKESKRK